MSERCETCRFWQNMASAVSPIKFDESAGECRKYAPRGAVQYGPILDPSGPFVASGWAVVARDDWCGEHQPIPAKEPHNAR